jgi:lipopolysaccharide/colanic/teichoic acid biosynthesis glycosyltransferase
MTAPATTSVSPAPVGGAAPVAKRAFDLVVALLTVLLLAPLLVAIAVAVVAESRGPVLYRQTRVGRGGRPFRILKFRTMVVGADRIGPNISPTDDPRITLVGRFLRRWYLDELPQLLNVVAGQMSFVGPRPETPEFVALYEPDALRLLAVRPGVMGPSTLASMDEEDRLAAADDPLDLYVSTILPTRVEADLGYLDTWTLAGDLRLMAAQFGAIVRRQR